MAPVIKHKRALYDKKIILLSQKYKVVLIKTIIQTLNYSTDPQ